MPKYRKKPVVIEAEVFKKGMEDDSECEYEDCVELNLGCSECKHYKPFIKTLEGNMYISPGDYIITGIKGERYPCKPDIFEATYEPCE